MVDWVSVEDRLPDIEKRVWLAQWQEYDNAAYEYVSHPYVTFGYMDVRRVWWDEWDRGSDGKPSILSDWEMTHWAEFETPEPPKDCGP